MEMQTGPVSREKAGSGKYSTFPGKLLELLFLIMLRGLLIGFWCFPSHSAAAVPEHFAAQSWVTELGNESAKWGHWQLNSP